jgi:hypothetical protein
VIFPLRMSVELVSFVRARFELGDILLHLSAPIRFAGGCVMTQVAFEDWKREREAIHKEMDCLLSAGWPKTAEECQVRKVQFMALIERRNAAARNLLKPDVAKAGDKQELRPDPERPSDDRQQQAQVAQLELLVEAIMQIDEDPLESFSYS